jgi:hypothetical protein
MKRGRDLDSSRLAEALRFLVNDEVEFETQEKLVAVRDALTNLVSNPAEPAFQKTFSESLQALRETLETLIETYSPSQRERIFALGARPYFTPQLATKITQSVSQNPISPSVTLELMNKLISQRQAFVDNARTTLDGLTHFGVEESELSDGEADVGFEIPRAIFDNKLNGMIKELRTIQRIIRVFSEVRTGEVSEIEVHDISASDPIFFFGFDPITIATLGGAVTWALAQWKAVEEIRKVRAETRKLNAFSVPEIKDFFDAKIEGIVHEAVKKETEALLKKSPLSGERKNELTSEVEWALTALFARIERGLKVEVRHSLAEPADGEKEPKEKAETRGELDRIRAELVFPKVEGSPILALPSVKDADPYKPSKPSRRKRRQAPKAAAKAKSNGKGKPA